MNSVPGGLVFVKTMEIPIHMETRMVCPPVRCKVVIQKSILFYWISGGSQQQPRSNNWGDRNIPIPNHSMGPLVPPPVPRFPQFDTGIPQQPWPGMFMVPVQRSTIWNIKNLSFVFDNIFSVTAVRSRILLCTCRTFHQLRNSNGMQTWVKTLWFRRRVRCLNNRLGFFRVTPFCHIKHNIFSRQCGMGNHCNNNKLTVNFEKHRKSQIGVDLGHYFADKGGFLTDKFK